MDVEMSRFSVAQSVYYSGEWHNQTNVQDTGHAQNLQFKESILPHDFTFLITWNRFKWINSYVLDIKLFVSLRNKNKFQ